MATAQVPASSLDVINTTPSARTLTLRKRPRVSYVEQLEYSSEEEDNEEEKKDDAGSIELDSPPTAKKVNITKEKPIPKRKIFPFLSLPNEIKNAIYEICLTDDNGVYLISQILHYRRTVKRAKSTDTGSFNRRGSRISGNWWQNGRKFHDQSNLVAPAPARMSPEILSISCEIRDEALPCLYSGNDFTFEDTQAMHAFLVQIGPKNCALLSDLTIKGWGFSRNLKGLNHPAMSSLAAATNLKKLRIDCAMTWFGGSSSMKRAASRIYRDGYHFLEAYGVANGSYDAAVDILELSPAAVGSTSQQINELDEQYEARKENGHKIFKEELREMLGREW